MTDAETSQGTIDEVLARLSATFAARTTHGIDYRTFTLKQLAFLVRDNEDAICAALKADFDRSAAEVRASELWVIYNEVELAVRRLPKWMADEPRDADAILAYRSMAPRVHKQPKGVSLIIGAWNFPFLLTLNPLVGAIAAGCPAVIKPSEHAPASARLLAELIPKYLDADAYAVVLGGAGTAARLLDRQWGHILFTGNGTVGKIVAQAAAKTLTPTTLELGGKSPVIIAADADLEIGVRRMLSMKQYGMGQVCVAADYILCARERVDELTRLCGQVLQEFYPPAPHARSALTGEHTSALRSERDFDRLDAALDDAGAGVVVRGERDRGTRRMGVSVVVLGDDGKSGAGLFAREEIFGPALAVVPVADVDEAIAYVNARPHPLALYVLSRGRATFDKVVEQTTSGSATWNDFGFGTIARNLPFGGVGDSGWGSYHGVDGFRTFTHHKSVLEIPLWMELVQRLRYPPNFSPTVQRLFAFLLSSGTPFSRPTTVEAEARRRRRRQALAYAPWLVAAVAVAAAAAMWAGKWGLDLRPVFSK